jgi:hypothetical protein
VSALLHFSARLVLLPVLVLAAALLLIHAQPYDNHELRGLLLPEGCPAPCFMGIRPGVTTMDETYDLLKSNKWVGEIRQRSGSIEWTWSDLAPNLIDRRYPGYAQHSNIPSEDCCVGSLKFNSRFTLGDLYLLLGKPQRTYIIRAPSDYALVSISYVEQKIRLFSSVGCPINRQTIWQIQLETYIESKTLYDYEGGMSADIVC